MGIEGPVARIVEDEDSVNLDSVIIRPRAVFSVRESAVGYRASVGLVVLWGSEGPEGWEGGYEVCGCEDVCEAVAVETELLV